MGSLAIYAMAHDCGNCQCELTVTLADLAKLADRLMIFVSEKNDGGR